MDMKILQPFFDAALTVPAQMFGVEAKSGTPHTLDSNDNHNWDISGFIGIVGAHQGVAVLRFSLATIEHFMKASGVETKDERDRADTVSGLVAEMTNIVAGNAISAYDYNLDISPPVVIKGPKHKIAWPNIAPVVAVEYGTSFGSFELCVCFNAV